MKSTVMVLFSFTVLTLVALRTSSPEAAMRIDGGVDGGYPDVNECVICTIYVGKDSQCDWVKYDAWEECQARRHDFGCRTDFPCQYAPEDEPIEPVIVIQ